MCEALGTEPKEEDIPVEITDFPSEIQEVLAIFNYLPDRWDSMSGTYFGKDFSVLPILLDIHNMELDSFIFMYLKVSESSLINIYSEEAKVRRKSKKANKAS